MTTPKRSALAFIIPFICFLAGSSVCSGQEAKAGQIDRNGVLILVRSTLLALDHADKTGNYTVLRELGSPQFQINTAARLGEIFASLRRDKLDLSGVSAIEPQLTILPQIESNGMLHMSGFFPSIPTQINFDLLYAPVDGQWRLFGVSVGTSSASPTAPKPPVTPSASWQPKPPAVAPKGPAR